MLVSDTPFASQNLSATLQQSGVTDVHIAGVAGRQTDLAIGTTGRYVRVQLAGQNFLQLAEVQIYGAPAPVPPPVLAIENSSLDTADRALLAPPITRMCSPEVPLISR